MTNCGKAKLKSENKILKQVWFLRQMDKDFKKIAFITLITEAERSDVSIKVSACGVLSFLFAVASM